MAGLGASSNIGASPCHARDLHLNAHQVALAFLNDTVGSTHGYLRPDSVLISPSGEWKLGGFELLSNPTEESPVLYVSADRWVAHSR